MFSLWFQATEDVLGSGCKSTIQWGMEKVFNPVNAFGSGDKMVMTVRGIRAEGKVGRL